MKKPFIHQDFLLQSEAAKKLYHNYSADQPIIDYHCHLPPQEIAEDKNFKNITKIWLDGDHYKWRAMRTCGVDEKFITGSASDKEKFLAWAKTVPKTLKNPLYHWTHMELKNPFGITEQLLNGDSAEKIWDKCNEMLQSPEFSTRGLLKQNNVKVVATTDDPTDKLEFHTQFNSEDEDAFKMVPTFRPDRGMEIENGDEWRGWVEKLAGVSGVNISSFSDFLKALKQRHDFFDEMGCRASDHGTDRPYSDDFKNEEIENIFLKVLSGKSPSNEETRKFKSAFLYHCGIMDAEKGWVYQLHVGAIRNNNSRMMKELGRDTGFDSIGDFDLAQPLAHLLNRLDSEDQLPKVILYNSNPRDNELMSTMIGNFQDGTVSGKLQHGPPWWFLDQKDGIEAHITSLSNMGVLSQLIGMTTDSRSFLSFPRHEYYRRVLCNILGDDVENGLIPDDLELVGSMVQDISYNNAASFFGF
ncbi:glucuronate isomerase [Gracilimonas sp.]|uniref:glucuronate isomerase n=1 Tax=Gracilimonas sp. TaxID=1974203 RepID=UPI0032ED4E0C